jgi:hypothetical protein
MESELDRHIVAARCLEEIKAKGYEIELSTDFETVENTAKKAGRRQIMPTFAIAPSHLTKESAFWLFLKKEGEPVAGVAAALQDLGRECLADFLKRTYRHQFPHPTGETILEVAEPLYEVSGKVVYVGELARHDKDKGSRQVLKAFMRMLQLIIVAKWEFNTVYAFIPERHFEARLDRVYSFCTAVERAQVWNEPAPPARSSDEYFVGSTRTQLANSLRAEARGYWAPPRARTNQEGVPVSLVKSSQ